MTDILLEKMFEKERWEYALEKGVGKKIAKAELIKLMDPMERAALYLAIKDGIYKILPAHMAQIPKDNGEFRTVYINEDRDRIILAIINDLFFELCPEMVHERCKSYQKTLGCGKVVKEVASLSLKSKRTDFGIKSDLSKYFDTVSIEVIDSKFDEVKKKFGKSAVLDMIRTYYHQNLCFDLDGNLIEKFQSLMQGCSLASWLADSVLYDIDEKMSKMCKYYVRYSDDCLILDEHWEECREVFEKMLNEKGLTLNPKKVEVLYKNKAYKFLGFSIRGSEISLSKSRIKSFQKEIESRTIKSKKKNVVHDVCKFLYGDSKVKFSWATSVLPVINVKEDIDTLNEFVMDSIRASMTGKKK